jgi:hypothetical protein
MPTFELTGPDGGTYHVDAPDEHAAVAAFSDFHGSQSAPAQAPDTLTDVAKSVGSGLVHSAISTLGAPGDLGTLAQKVGDMLPSIPQGFSKVSDFLKDESAKSAKYYGASGDLPGSYVPPTTQQLESSTTGPEYKPQTGAGEVAQRISEFAPGVIGGPESLATRVLTRAVAPALGSEAAGKLTEGTALQPYAEVAGALAGGAGASAGLNKFNSLVAASKAAKAVPTTEALKDAARSGYDHPDVAAVKIQPQAASDLGATIENDLVQQGFRPRAGQGGLVFDTIRELKNAPGPVSVQDIDSVRKALGQVGKSGIPTADSVAAKAAITHIDDFLPNLKQSDLIAGDAAKATQILQDARGNWAAAKRSDMLNSKIDAAELQAASANSGHNLENALRQRVRSILTSPKLSRGLSDDERNALESFVRGTVTSNVIRHVGNVLGGGGGLGHLLTAGAGAVTAGVPGAILGPMAGTALKAFSNASAGQKIRALDTMLRSRSPLALQAAQQMPRQLISLLPKQSAAILASMAAQSAASQQQQQPIQQPR